MPKRIPSEIKLTVGSKESRIEFLRRVLMEAARQVGLPLREQIMFAEVYYSLCGTPKYYLAWTKGDPSPGDTSAIKDTEFDKVRGKAYTIPLVEEQRIELARRRDYFRNRGGKLFSAFEAPIIHQPGDENAEFIAPCVPLQLQNNFKTSIECRADALRKLGAEIGARAEFYPTESRKLFLMLSTAGSMAKGGAAVTTIVGGPLAAPIGTIAGAGLGVGISVFTWSKGDAKVEAPPVKNFLQRIVECSKMARIEAQARARATQNSMSASTSLPQMFVVTKQFGIFALYPFTIKRGPTLLGDYVIEEHGANPTDPIPREQVDNL